MAGTSWEESLVSSLHAPHRPRDVGVLSPQQSECCGVARGSWLSEQFINMTLYILFLEPSKRIFPLNGLIIHVAISFKAPPPALEYLLIQEIEEYNYSDD